MNFQEILLLQPTPENKQYIFDRVATHLMTQSRKSVDPTSDKLCKYRGPDGCMCAIGCLMTDEEYKPAFEGCAATHFRYQEINGFAYLLINCFIKAIYIYMYVCMYVCRQNIINEPVV